MGYAIADQDGKWQTRISKSLAAGQYLMSGFAIDLVGNRSQRSAFVTLVIDPQELPEAAIQLVYWLPSGIIALRNNTASSISAASKLASLKFACVKSTSVRKLPAKLASTKILKRKSHPANPAPDKSVPVKLA